MTSVKVAVRVRPQAQRELDAGEAQVVHIDQERGVIAVTNLKVPQYAEGDSRERTRHFSFDACYDTFTPQDALFQEVGHRVLDALASGYNACVLAYGQSGSGKTFTMMGRQNQPGLTPRICQALFSRLNQAAVQASPDENILGNIRVAVCFLEIHKERVKDLLAAHAPPLRVREHPQTGPYVQDLSVHEVGDAETLMSLLTEGNARRCTARSGEHARSSRSHAVFTISCPQGRAHLVDLAGSERAEFSSRERREEGANINKSLVTLGNVISTLAERPRCCHIAVPRRCSHAHVYVPYRDSVLTWLLRDSLGGNAKTFMIATVSPSSGCYSETVNTLRYAQRAKRIVNQPVVNTGMPEEAAARTIRELRAEVNRLRAVLAALQGNGTLKHGGLSEGRGDSLTRRWIARWYAHQLQESNATQSVRSASTSTSSHHAQMGQRASSHSPAATPGTRSSSQSLAEEASEATERTNSTLLLPVMFVDHANTGRTELKRTFSSCELVYRKPARALHRVQRRYSSHDSIPHNNTTADHTLSPGGSENSLASSSSSLESQRSLDSRLHRSVTGTSNAYKKKVFKSAIPIRIPTSRSSSESSERRLSTTSIASSSSVPDLSRSNNPVKKKKADIVAAVTQRLYPKKKVKGVTSHTEEPSTTCARASLRDLSKRLLIAARNKTEAETQTEKDNETKEASVGTDKIPPPEPIHAFITSEIFMPTMCLCQFDNVTDGVSVQPDLLGPCRDSPCSASGSNATISPSISVELPPCFKHCDEECFSDDSLDSKRDIETDSLDGEKPCLWKVVNLSSGQDFLGTESSNNNSDNMNKKAEDKLNRNVDQAKNLHTKIENNNDSVVIEGELPVEENWEISVLIGDESDLENSSVNLKISNEKLTDDENNLFNGLPLSSEESEHSRPQSSDDNNSCPSPISSDAASTGSDSSSGDDFVYYLQAPDDKGPSARCLYTIAENSEHSDHSESMEPSLSPPLHVPLSSQKIEQTDSILHLPQEKNESNNNNNNKNQANFLVENILSSINNPVTTPPLIPQNCVSFPMNISTPVFPKSSDLLLESSAVLIPEATLSTPQTSAVMRATPFRAHTVLTSSLLGSPPLSSTHENVKQNMPMSVSDESEIHTAFEPQIQNTIIQNMPVACRIETKNPLPSSHESLNLIINSHDKGMQNSFLNSNKNLSDNYLRDGDQLNSKNTISNVKNHSQIVSNSLSENLLNATSLNTQNKNSESRINAAVKNSLTNSYELPNLVTSTEFIPKNLTINVHNSNDNSTLTSHLLNTNSDIPLTSIKNPIRNDNAAIDFTVKRNENALKNQILNTAPNSSVENTYNVVQRQEPQNTYSNTQNNVLKNPLCNIYEPLSSPKLVSRSPSPRLSFENASQSPPTYFNNNISSQSPNLFQVENSSPNFSFNYTQKQNSYETENSNPKYYQSNLKSRSPSPNLINLNTPPPELLIDSKNLQRDMSRNYSPHKHDNLNNSYTFPDNTRYLPQSQIEIPPPMLRESEISYPSNKSPPYNNWPSEQPPSYILPSVGAFAQSTTAPLLPTLSIPQQGRQTAVTTLNQAFSKTATFRQEPPIIARPYAAHQQSSTSRDVMQSENRRAEPLLPRRYLRDRSSVSPEQTVQWADPRQRQFLNVSVVAPTRALPASVGLQDTSTASEDSITFVYVGPARRHAPPVLLELVRRSVGGRGLQRSVSLDSATRALARLSQRRRSEVVRACSMDTLVPEETHAFLEPARRERAPHVPELPRRSPPRRSFSPATPSDSEVKSTDDEFDDVPPPELPRATGIDTEKSKRWIDMKQIILGQQPRPQTSPSPPLPPRPRTVGKKAVSWSDVSGCGLLSSTSTHSLPSPTSLLGSPKPIIKKSTLAPVPQSPVPSPTSRSPQARSPVPGERIARRDRLYLDLQTPQWPQDTNRISPDFRRHQANRLSPEPLYYESRPEPIWTRERSMSAPSSPYREHPWYSRLQEEHSPSPEDWHRERRGSSASAPDTPLSGSPGNLNFQRYARSRSPPRCSSPRCRSLGDVSELGRDAESLRAFLAQATTLLHSLSDLSRFLEQQPIPQQRSAERAVQTDAEHSHAYGPSRPSRTGENNHPIPACDISRPRFSQRSDPIPIHLPPHCCSHVHSCCSHAHHSCTQKPTRSPRPWYEPSVLERQLEASCARLETSLQQPPEWETLFEEDPRSRGATSRPAGSPTPRYTPMPPLPSRSVRPHFSPRAYMRHLLGVRRRIIEAARQEQLNKNPDDI